jgi:hypothetical protein
MRARRTVLMICDGMRADLVRPDLCPAIFGLRGAGTSFDRHRSVFPSVTRTSSASMATGHHPGQHGLHGNTMALPENGGYAVHNVGDPKFVGAMRDALGRTLSVPVTAERLKHHGGAILFSNVSPGAAYFHDPDGHGHVYHRAGSYGPGRMAVADPLTVSHDAAGDAAMTARFCDEILTGRKPRHAALWLADPDKTMHASELGSPQHLDAVARVDACVSRVAETVARLRDAGDDILFLLGSDHGQETTRDVVPVERLIHEAGFKREIDSDELVVAPQGTSALVYASAEVPARRIDDLVGWLAQQPWCGAVWAGDELAEVGLAARGGLRIAISMAKSDEPNRHGIAGMSDVAARYDAAEGKPGFGQHGGIGRYEQSPFLIAVGNGFAPGAAVTDPSSIIDIAPTVLAHLGISAGGMQGRALQRDQ